MTSCPGSVRTAIRGRFWTESGWTGPTTPSLSSASRFSSTAGKDLYAAKGLRAPETHEELLENIAALHDPPGRYGYLLTNQYIADTFNLKTAMWTHGAYFFDAEDNLALDRPETLKAWAFYKELGKYSPPGSMAQGDLESRELMLDGRVAHMFTTTSFAADFGPEDLRRQGAFAYPIQPGAKGASLDFNALALPARSRQPELAKDMIGFPPGAGKLPGVSDPYRRGLGSHARGRLDRPVPESPPDRGGERVPGSGQSLARDRHRLRGVFRAFPALQGPDRHRHRKTDRRPPGGLRPESRGGPGMGRLGAAEITCLSFGSRMRAADLKHSVYVQIAGVVLTVPALLLLALVVVLPFVTAVWWSLSPEAGTGPTLAGYRWILDPAFFEAFKHSLYIGVGSVLLELVIAIPAAILLNQAIPARGFCRAALMLPWAVPTIAVAAAFLWLANTNYGLFNQLGLGLGLLEAPIAFLGFSGAGAAQRDHRPRLEGSAVGLRHHSVPLSNRSRPNCWKRPGWTAPAGWLSSAM